MYVSPRAGKFLIEEEDIYAQIDALGEELALIMWCRRWNWWKSRRNMRRNDSLPFGRSSARSGADEDIGSGAGLGRHVFGPVSRGCGHSGDQRGRGDLAFVRKREGSGCAAGAGLDVQDGDRLGGAGSGLGQGCGGAVAGCGGGEFADGVAEIPQPAFRSFGGGVGGRGFGWVCGAQRPDSGKGSGEVDGGAGEGGEAWGGFDDDSSAGASGGGGLDDGEAALGRAGGAEVAGGVGVEGGGEADSGQDGDIIVTGKQIGRAHV